MKALNIILWIIQVVLGAMFFMAGFMKVSTPLDQLAQQMAWVADVGSFTRIIGIAELLGAIGLILPAALRIQPKLTGFAAIGLATIMLLAMIFHISRGETSIIGINIILGLVAGFIAWGRISKVPIQSKS